MVVKDVEIERRGLLDPAQRNLNVLEGRFERDAANFVGFQEQEELFGDDAILAVSEKLQTHGTRTDLAGRTVEAEVATTSIVVTTCVCAYYKCNNIVE